MAILTDQLRRRAVEHGRARLPHLCVWNSEGDLLVLLARFQIKRKLTFHEHHVILYSLDAELQGIVAGVINPRRQVKRDDIALDLALHAHVGAQAIALARLKPHRPNGATARLIPDAATLVDTGCLLTARNL